jgi:hypothetical protein
VVRGERLVRCQRDVQEQRPEEEERTQLRIDEQRVLAEPAQPGALREVALEHGTAVHERTAVHVAELCAHPGEQDVELVPHHPMVVGEARIPRHRPGRLRAVVVKRDHQRTDHPRHRTPRVAPQLGPAFEIRHLAVMAGGEPVVEVLCRLRRAERGDAGEIESRREGLRLEAVFEPGGERPAHG